jgi:hypothetical protein
MIIMIIITILWLLCACRMILVEAFPSYNKICYGGLGFMILSPLLAFWQMFL